MWLSKLPPSPLNLVLRLRWQLQMLDLDPSFPSSLFLLSFGSFDFGTKLACFLWWFYSCRHWWMPEDMLCFICFRFLWN
jgi:hypothetical protein